jgi:hypothetical protein
VCRPERRREVVADAVLERLTPRQDRCVRGARERHRHRHRLEDAPCGRHPVEHRRGGGFRAVRADAVGPQRVDRDQQHVGRPLRRPRLARHAPIRGDEIVAAMPTT